ncbi:unnamed protein product [Phaedon cochleariae]|uniref:Centrosome-associated zinc finger protein CP190 n=1 Tax=Phaedon cochleariae TaxID=80249 RepID=A0A9P0GL62_PHACE|nr:unnamed protein product [Phaedon cochleariae]
MKMVEGSKQVRVDNWGVFFLQRLQMFFSKTDYCDLTLQFEGNVQLKVHRLVMNACTEYFTILERNYPAVEENTIMMPGDLQSDVIVPIVNFMYTGMLEFHMSIFEKLYSAAELMNITILTKLLDAQRTAYQQHRLKQMSEAKPKSEVSWMKKTFPKEKAPSFSNDLPHPLPGRKVPVWKRKAAPPPVSHPVSQLHFPEHGYPIDPLSIPDNTPKPTRFEWPEDDLPPINFMDTSFEDFTLTSLPLLTKEDEDKAKPSFDDLRYNVEVPKKKAGSSKASSSNVNTAQVEEFVKEQKIRTAMFEDVENGEGGGQKRKMDQGTSKQPSKKVKVNNKENHETTISVEGSDFSDLANIDHTKIVAEILKKYPDLVKKNKNIKLKIMTSGNNKNSPEKISVQTVVENTKKPPPPIQAEPVKVRPQNSPPKKHPKRNDAQEEGPWMCQKCMEMGGESQEFVLYYLYRKHMTDSHNETFDANLCKYCGKRCGTDNLMLYHLYTKHALKPPAGSNFPKCDRCPFIAQSNARLDQHKEMHKPNEMQCQDCKLAFSSSHALGAHVRVTSHYNKPGKVSFDCQYCMKKLQSAINLFTHIKNSHLREGKRDGIVCLDELDSMEDLDEEQEETGKDEYIVPEILPGITTQKDKVKIISNVKVPPNRQKADSTQSTQVIQLDPSSEAESLNNVASGIATSLGLVDIVVLDENQQYILQQDAQGEGEFIIPDLGTGQSFARQVITTQHNTVIQQGMIQSAGSDIGSTDELVMVLTDHEYPDEQEGEHSDNSNIVVLYSHPVEGQEGQFITSQGNLLVNSQTGMLEIRNGTSIATSSSDQVVVTNNVDTPVESIEMIHREIHGTDAVMKQEPYFEEDRKPEVPSQQIEDTSESQEEVEEDQSEEAPEESETQESHVNGDNEDNVLEQEENPDKENESEDHVDSNENMGTEEPMEIDEIEENDRTKISENDEQGYATQDSCGEKLINTSTEEDDEQSAPLENREDQEENVDSKEHERAQEEGADVPPEKPAETEEEENVIVNDPANLPDQPANSSMEDNIEGDDEVERMDVDGKIAEKQDLDEQDQEQDQEHEQGDEEMPEEENSSLPEGLTQPEEPQTEESQPEESQPEESQPVESQPEESQPEESQPEETTTEVQPEEPPESQDPVTNEEVNEVTLEKNEDVCEASRENDKTLAEGGSTLRKNETQEKSKKSQVDINKAILDDWGEDDTDSQQSEKHVQEGDNFRDEAENQTRAVDNVNKLMDDWEEEEEEEKKDAE